MKHYQFFTAVSIALCSHAATSQPIDVNLANSTFQGGSRDSFTLKKVNIPGVGDFDVVLKWDPQTFSFTPQSATESASSQLKITGPTTVNESESITLTAAVVNTDGTSVPSFPVWSVTPNGVGTITQSGFFTAQQQAVDVDALITISDEVGGKTLTTNHTVKVKNVPSPLRTCSAYLENYAGSVLLGEFAVDPDNRKIGVKLTAMSGNPYFFYSRLFLVQGTNSIDTTLGMADNDTALLLGLGGWDGYGQIAAPGVKQAALLALPASLNVSQRFTIRYTSTPAVSIDC